jgi:phytoene synthase
VSGDADRARAYAHCEAITRRRAANFYYGIRLLPAQRRRAMCAVYAFARRVDDIGDGTLPRAQKLEQLERQAQQLPALGAAAHGAGPPAGGVRGDDAPAGETGGADLVIAALADASARFALPQKALSELIEGVRMDVEEARYEHFDELVLYCRHVAGAIGRLCLAIFSAGQASAQSASARSLADDLGVAMQLTNILRDLREDAENGRVYLPAQELRRFGVLGEEERRPAAQVLTALARASADAGGAARRNVTGEGAHELERHERLCELMRFQAQRAQGWFDRGMGLAPLLDGRSAACVLAMAGIYRKLLDRVQARPERALAERIALPGWEKAWVAVTSMLASEIRTRRRRPASVGAVGRDS